MKYFRWALVVVFACCCSPIACMDGEPEPEQEDDISLSSPEQPGFLWSWYKNFSWPSIVFAPFSIVSRPLSWVRNLVCKNPKKIALVLLTTGIAWGGYRGLFALQSRMRQILDSHGARVARDTEAFSELSDKGKLVRERNRALQRDMGKSFDELGANIDSVGQCLDEFGNQIDGKISMLDEGAQRLADRDGLCSLGREIGDLALDIARALEKTQAGA